MLLTAPYTRRAERPDGGLYDEDLPERVDAWNRLLREVAARHPTKVTVFDLNRVVCPDGEFTWSIDGLRVRTDGLHFTERASARGDRPVALTSDRGDRRWRRAPRRCSRSSPTDTALRCAVSLTVRTATPPSGQMSTMEIPAGSRYRR